MCSKVDEFIKTYKPDLLFVSTEDTEYLDHLSNKYGKNIIFLEKDNIWQMIYQCTKFKKIKNLKMV